VSEPALLDRPYKGLMPYSDTEEDAQFFFGREAEREIIAANLMAARLTLLYGASGVGKSSVLNAGVAQDVRGLIRRNRDERGAPELAIVVFRSWRDDPVAALTARVGEAVSDARDGRAFDSVPPSLPLEKALEEWTKRLDGDLLVILDQFEEYFLYHPQEDGAGTFAAEFPRVVNRPNLRVHVLVSIREDALAKLDRFKGRIAGLFDNYLRLEHLDPEAARDAIVRPIGRYNELRRQDDPPMAIEPALVESVLAQVRAGEVTLGAAGRGVATTGGVLPEPEADTIETPFLQLVMTRLWDEEKGLGSLTLRPETLTRLGGARSIVRQHLDAVLGGLSRPEREAAADVLRFLVTPSGSKIAQDPATLARWTERPRAQVESVLARLESREASVLRRVQHPDRSESYEIFHDVLAKVVLDYVTIREAERSREQVRAQWLVIAGLSVGLLFAVSLIVFAWWQRGIAKEERARAEKLSGQNEEQRAKAVAARINAEKAGAESKKSAAQAGAINDFLVDMLSQASPEQNARERKVTVEEVLDRAAKKIGTSFPQQPEIEATVRETIGSTYHSLGDYPKAETHLRIALKLRNNILGAEHPDTLTSMNNLAAVLSAQGKLPEAETLYRQVREARRRALGSEHPDTLTSMNNLAAMLRARGELPEAETLHRQVREARRRVLGSEHPDMLASMNNLAAVLRAQGRLPEAETLHRQVRDARRRVLGAEHPQTLTSMNYLAAVLSDQGNVPEAEKLFRQVLEIRRRVLGAEHPDTLLTMNNLAFIHLNRNEPAAAEPLLQEILRARRKSLPQGHPDLADALSSLGWALTDTGKAQEAEPLLVEALAIYRKVMPEHWVTADTESLLGRCLTALGRYDEAEPLLRNSYPKIQAGVGVPLIRVRQALVRIVALYEAWDKPEQAAEWRLRLNDLDFPADPFAR
jgi:tetratricopeptide (TPR) repeat protein